MPRVSHPPESVYNLIPRVEVKPEKPPRYKSKFSGQVKQEKKQNKSSHKTMGLSKVEAPSPRKYLVKHSKEPKLPEKMPFSYRDCQPRKPAVPAKTEKPLMGLSSNRDYVRSNFVDNIHLAPPKPQPVYTLTRRGDKKPLKNSGLVPQYLKKKDYGQTPEYLSQRQEEMRREQEEYDHYIKETMKKGAMKCLSEEQRQDVLHGLKTRWAELHHQYQGLSVIIDMLSKKQRKERLESEMKQLEEDIKLMERYNTIYISQD